MTRSMKAYMGMMFSKYKQERKFNEQAEEKFNENMVGKTA